LEELGLIEPDDVVRIIGLLGLIAGMTEPLAERRRKLVTELARLAGADSWLWLVSRGFEDGHVGPLWAMDGGFADEDERTRVWHINAQPEFGEIVTKYIGMDRHRSLQLDESLLTPDEFTKLAAWKKSVNMDHLFFMIYPLGGTVMSGIGMHRRPGKPPFSQRDRAIVHLVTSQIDWLHRAGTDVPANTPALAQLTPKLNEVMLYVLAGESRKEIARRLNRSEHTVGDYFKTLYRHFDVSSRAELLAKFIG
jgi:DNA-binding CsgD family transcriptional regulator